MLGSGITILAAIGLIIFGLDEWSRHTGSLLAPHVSAFSERFRHRTLLHILAGIVAGMSLQGRHGALYIKQRWLAGLLSPYQAFTLAMGMGAGMLAPAIAIGHLPDALRQVILITGLILAMLPRHAPAWRSFGQALIGLGCAGIGTSLLRTLSPLEATPPTVLALGAIVAVAVSFARLPAPLWLVAVCLVHAPSPIPSAAIAVVAFVAWAISVVRMIRKQEKPFPLPYSLLDYRDQPFPERALQTVLQEIRRMATGLSRTMASALAIPAPVKLSTTPDDLESAINAFKPAAQRYLKKLASRQLNEHQAMMILLLHQCVSDVERIGDHLHALTKTLSRPSPFPVTPVLSAITALLDTVSREITGNPANTRTSSERILAQCETTRHAIITATADLQGAIAQQAIPPAIALHCRDVFSHCERALNHLREIGMIEHQPPFLIDPDAVHLRARHDHSTPIQPTVSSHYRTRRQPEED